MASRAGYPRTGDAELLVINRNQPFSGTRHRGLSIHDREHAPKTHTFVCF